VRSLMTVFTPKRVGAAVLTNVTLVNSNSALPDDGDYTETCWSCFNVNCNVHLKKTFASVG